MSQRSEPSSLPMVERRQRPSKNTTPGTVAGFLFQFERALLHLAAADTYSAEVGIETLDDVAVREGSELLLLEQNKHTVAEGILTDRTYSLWHSLRLWASGNHKGAKLLLVTNRGLSGSLVTALADTGSSPAERLRLLKAAATASPSRADARVQTRRKLKEEIESVVGLSDATLRQLLGRVTIIGAETTSRPTQATLAAKLGIPQEEDGDFVLNQVLGWLVTRSMAAWREHRPAWFSRAECLKVCAGALRRAARRRILPRPGREVVVSATERERARGYAFVHHLTLIQADGEDIEQAIEHWVQFGIERHRLVDEGEVPLAEWTDRGERLIGRWKNIRRQTMRSLAGQRPTAIGVKIFELTTYEHRERICGEECDELYMTSGHYHRLVDVARVWWSPEVERKDAD